MRMRYINLHFTYLLTIWSTAKMVRDMAMVTMGNI